MVRLERNRERTIRNTSKDKHRQGNDISTWKIGLLDLLFKMAVKRSEFL